MNKAFANKTGEDAFTWTTAADRIDAGGEGVPTLRCQIGQIKYPVCESLIDSTAISLCNQDVGYVGSQGILKTRQAIAEDFNQLRGTGITADHVGISPGAKPWIFATCQAFLKSGDFVFLPRPGYPIYEAEVKYMGAIPVPLPLKSNGHIDLLKFGILVERLKPKLVILNYPANPAGVILTRSEAEKISKIAVQHDLLILSDEAYSRILYDNNEFVSVSSFPGMLERTIVIDAMSKTGAVPGFRMGWGVVPLEIMGKFTTFLGNIYSCVPPFIQIGVAEVLGKCRFGYYQHVSGMVAELQSRRDLLCEGMRTVPKISFRRPQGAMYLWVNIQEVGKSSFDFCELLMHKWRLVTLPGTSFNQEGYIRICFGSTPQEVIPQISQRITDCIASL
jgi:aspartate/methionine/tyrosine aminotransferase